MDKKEIDRLELAIYGKGGIGKSTLCANLSAALQLSGRRVLQIGCDPKHDSTRLLLGGQALPTVLEYLRDTPKEAAKTEEIIREGYLGIGCIEAGGPQPGIGCAGRGIISAFDFLERNHTKEKYDTVLYDVLGDVVCGGFAVPIRREYANAIFLVTSGEFMAIYAANNILRGIRNYDGTDYRRVAGILFNSRNVADETGRVERFARAVGLPICARIPRSQAFARAEEKNCVLMALEEYETERRVFQKLAAQVSAGLPLYEASPLEDADLERIVLSGPATQVFSFSSKPQDGKKTGDSFPKQGEEETSVKASQQPNTLPAPAPRRLPLYGCAFNGAAVTAVHLSDAIVIAHSPKACAFYTWQTISSSGRKNLFNRGILMPSALCPKFESTDITQTEAVFGGMEKLKASVRAALARKPGAVIVISSCVSGIIGDDIREVEAMSTPQVPVLAIPADGDIAGDYMEGIRMSLHKIASALIGPAPLSEIPPRACINLIGEAGVSNHLEINYRTIKSLLGQMGISINCRFLGDAKVEDLRRFQEAPLNVLADGGRDNLRLEAYLKENYGCRFFDQPLPVGFTATKDFLLGIGAFFGCEKKAYPVIAAEEACCKARIEALKPSLKGKKILLTTISISLDWLVLPAVEAGMEFVWIGVLDYLRQGIHLTSQESVQAVTEEMYDIRAAEEKIKALSPDLVVSNYTFAVERGNYILDSLPMTQTVGFYAGVEVLERWDGLFEKGEEGEWIGDRDLYEKYYA